MLLIRRPDMTPYAHVRLKQISMARIVRKYTRVCLAYVCLELTHEKLMDTYLEKKTHRAETTARIHGKKPARLSIYIFKQMADHRNLR